MAIPEGYTKLGLVGYSDKGTYTAEATYNRYNVVLHNGSTYVALKDGLTGVEPSDDKVNWKYFARGFEAEMASEVTAVDKYNIAGGTPDPTGASTTEVMLQLLLDKYSDQIVNKLVSNEGFQQKLMEYIINNGATNQEGYVADARQLNPEVEGSLAAQLSSLNANKQNSLELSADTNPDDASGRQNGGWAMEDTSCYFTLKMDWSVLQFRITPKGGGLQRRYKYGQSAYSEWKEF